MPIYEYTCQDCDHRFEKFVRSMSSKVEAVCPQCGGTRTRKGWSTFGTAGGNFSLGGLGASAASDCSPGGT